MDCLLSQTIQPQVPQICNERSLFIGMFETTLETAHGAQTKEQKVGTIKLKLADYTGQECVYDISGVVYDPKSPYNLPGVPFLSIFLPKMTRICMMMALGF